MRQAPPTKAREEGHLKTSFLANASLFITSPEPCNYYFSSYLHPA